MAKHYLESFTPAVYPYGVRHTPEMIRDLSLRATAYRRQVLQMVYDHQTGHLGGAFSVAEILTALYFHHLRIDPQQPERPDRDRLLFSKGHACAMLYTVLAHRGYFALDNLSSFRSLHGMLQGHPEPQTVPGVEIPAGPLGHGVAVGAGMGLAARLLGSGHRVYAILGDGEINAGVVWEGALVAAHHRVDNLTVILDYNGVQQTGWTAQVLSTEPIVDKWRAFGWHTIEIHGHNMAQVLDALDTADEIHARPTAIIARTTKGKGVSFMENNHVWHGQPPNEAQFQAARVELEERMQTWQNS